jgi:hypothetical protein
MEATCTNMCTGNSGVVKGTVRRLHSIGDGEVNIQNMAAERI